LVEDIEKKCNNEVQEIKIEDSKMIKLTDKIRIRRITSYKKQFKKLKVNSDPKKQDRTTVFTCLF